MNDTIMNLDLVKARRADLLEQARRRGLAKRAVRRQDKSANKVHTVHSLSRSGERSMT
jgi:hypothetical protein